jgi:tetratricopeptide (TPR) repeat protein
LLQHASDQYQKGDYYEAIDFFEQARLLDPENPDILWQLAQTHRAYKNYIDASKYYASVYARDEDRTKYPEAQLYYGLMEKQQGHYKEALTVFKEVKRDFSEDKASATYKKATQEVEACNWVLKQLKNTKDTLNVQQLALGINSTNAEFGHTVWHDTLYFSALRPDSINEELQEVYDPRYSTQLYAAPLTSSPSSQPLLKLQKEGRSIGNASIFSDGQQLFYSECQDLGAAYQCQIRMAIRQNGHWITDSAFQAFGQKGKNSTMPCLSTLKGQSVLFYCSDQDGGKGGLDIWMLPILPDGSFGLETNLSRLNSPENEVSPWFDTLTTKLYFSSTWLYGYGGHDIFMSQLQTNGEFGQPVNLGMPFNSPANDIYYFQAGDTTYFTSNRLGSQYAKNPTCCSDIYWVSIVRPKPKVISTVSPEISCVKLPIQLYFENDQPDAKTTADITPLNYEETYSKYKAQFPLYLEKVSALSDTSFAAKAQSDLASFFSTEVDAGMADLHAFTDQVWKALEEGLEVTLMVQGFASPLAKTDYNVHLTRRRIDSIKNYFEELDNGKFAPYMNSEHPMLRFEEVPMGEFKADKTVSDNYYDQRNSVYSKAASYERRIEIIEMRTTKKNQH